jgi:hypothetical protein
VKKKLQLRPNENILYPQNYVEDAYNPLIITTNRVMYSGSGKKREIDAAKIGYVGKGFHKKNVMVMLIVGLLGLPFLGVGVYKYYTHKDLPTKPPEVVKGQRQKPITQKDLATFQNNKNQQIIGIVLGAFGALFGGAAYLLYKRRLTVVVGGAGKAMEVPAKNAIVQDQIITMINASMTAAKAMAPPPMPPKVQKPMGAIPMPKLSK